MRASCKFLPVAAALLLAACSSSSTTPTNGGDDDDTSHQTDPTTPTTDAGPHDSGATTPEPDAGQDSGSTSVKAGLGETCAAAGDCESNQCFKGGQGNYCSLLCTAANAATVCVPPVFNGVCNKQGLCRKPN